MCHLPLPVISSRFVGLALLLAAFSAQAQKKETTAPRVGSSILDDSTRNVYGPATALWTTEKELFMNRPNYRPLDTTINNYHRWTYVQQSDNYYKDLGVMGTALSSIFPTVPSMIGATAGFQAYEPYYATEEPHYFDTKSPYTRMHIIWGGIGRAMTHIEFSRNVNPRWNIGFNYRPILIDKQIQRSGKGDRQTVSQYYDFYSTYASKDKKYFLLFNFRRIRHKVNENGGVALPPGDAYKDYFDPDARPNLIAAKTEEYRRNIHFFQQYQLAKPFQIYLISDFTKQTNAYSDDYTKDPKTFYDVSYKLRKDSTKASDETTFISMQQEGGIKGNAGKLFYSAYYKLRTFDYSNPHLDSIPTSVVKSGTENYLGGQLSLQLDSLSEISGSAEYLLGGFYRIDAKITTPWFDGYFKNALSKPGLMPMIYQGSHDYWNQSFSPISSTQAQGFAKLNTGPLQFSAGATFTLLHNYVFFKENSDPAAKEKVTPRQSSGNQSTFSPEVRIGIQFFKHIYFRPKVIYTSFLVNDDQALSIPEVFVNAQLTYENHLFKNHLQLQVGFDTHWQSAYHGLGYDIPIQQFYVQNTALSPAYPLIDIFFTGKMRRARFFIKYHNVVQLATKSGYLPTPGYPGQSNVLDFGFDFLLFD